jgi:hypothetical protein
MHKSFNEEAEYGNGNRQKLAVMSEYKMEKIIIGIEHAEKTE